MFLDGGTIKFTMESPFLSDFMSSHYKRPTFSM